jgi:hypothetical protein
MTMMKIEKAGDLASPDVESALRGSARWRLLGLLFERPRPSWRLEVEALAREVGEPRLSKAAVAARSFDEGPYLRILGPGGTVSPREAAYQPFHDPGQRLAAVRGFYETFAYRPLTAEDPADHVAVEIGFLGFMALKEAYALERDDHDAAELVRRAARIFMEEHLAVLAGGMPDKLSLSCDASAGHLLEAARLLREWCPCPQPSPPPDRQRQPERRPRSVDPERCDVESSPCGDCCL